MNPQTPQAGSRHGAAVHFLCRLRIRGHLFRHRSLHDRGADIGRAGIGISRKKLSPMPMFTAMLVLIAGGLTLYLRNDVFIKMKPTVALHGIFGPLLGGLRFNRLFIKYVFGEAFELDGAGLARTDLALGHLLSRTGGDQRSGLAQHLDGDLGLLQGLGHHRSDISVRIGTDPLPAEASAPNRNSSGPQDLMRTARLIRAGAIRILDVRAMVHDIQRFVSLSRLRNVIAQYRDGRRQRCRPRKENIAHPKNAMDSCGKSF